ncbi:Uncharacterised protein [Turicibacter sanguinis]|nr:Uncharacterised protein [Turicibacter sanguinis]
MMVLIILLVLAFWQWWKLLWISAALYYYLNEKCNVRLTAEELARLETGVRRGVLKYLFSLEWLDLW